MRSRTPDLDLPDEIFTVEAILIFRQPNTERNNTMAHDIEEIPEWLQDEEFDEGQLQDMLDDPLLDDDDRDSIQTLIDEM